MSSSTPSIAPAAAAPRRRIPLPKLFRPAREPTPSNYTFQDLKFYQPDGLWTGPYSSMASLIRKLGVLSIFPPGTIPRARQISHVPLAALGQVVGLTDERSQRLLRNHQRRMTRWGWVIGLVATLPNTLLMAPMILVLDYLEPEAIQGGSGAPDRALSFAMSSAATIAQVAVGAMAFVIAMRIAGLLVNRYFAESLCTAEALYLLIDLHREDVLSRPEYRRLLVDRFDILARATQLLTLRYPSNDVATHARLQRHFREMAAYIRTRQTWAIIPVATTLDDLRRDVHRLARIFVTGSYGEFTWQEEAAAQPELPSTWRTSLARTAGRVLGLGAPLAGMIYLIRHPDELPPGFGSQQLALIFFAWALLTLDSVLKLGVVAGLTGLAKGIKELR